MHLQTTFLTLVGALGSLPISLAQIHPNVTLVNPREVYALNATFPPNIYPILQTDMTSRPDCGEGSYRGSGRLQGLRALITGGDSGIGRAAVIAFLREGAQVAINYLPDEEADAEDLASFVSQEGFNIERIPGDLTNETFCGHLVSEAARRMGGLDILIGNTAYAGIQQGPGWQPLSNQSTTQLERVFRTNVFANFWLVRAALQYLPSGGSIVLTTSGMATTPQPQAVDYGATKACLSHMVGSMGRQLIRSGIRVNGVAPGLTYTPFLAALGWTADLVAQASPQLPMGRLEQPAELAPLYVSLVDPSGSYTTGGVYSATGAT